MQDVPSITAARSALLLILLSVAGNGAAQQIEPTANEPTVHWAYASFFGTGWYRIEDGRSVFVLRGTPSWSFGEAGFDEAGKRQIGYELRLPVAIGLARLDLADLPGLVDSENLSTASLSASLHVDIPITERFSLKPVGEVGYGRVIGEDDSAFIYRGELRARYRFQPGVVGWALVGTLGYSGYDANKRASDDNFSFTTLGAEFGQPVSWFPSETGQTILHSYLSYTEFIDDVDFGDLRRSRPVARVWEVGAALGRRDKPVRIWRLKFDRLGLGFKYDSTSSARGVRLVFRSMYDL